LVRHGAAGSGTAWAGRAGAHASRVGVGEADRGGMPAAEIDDLFAYNGPVANDHAHSAQGPEYSSEGNVGRLLTL